MDEWIIFVLTSLAIAGFAGRFYIENKTKERADKQKERLLSVHTFPDDLMFIDGIRAGIALDEGRQKLAILSPDQGSLNGEWEIFDLSDVLGGELDIDGHTVMHTSSSRSLLGATTGGLMFGAAGAVVGGLGGKTKTTSTEQTRKVSLKIYVQDMSRPIRVVDFLPSCREQAEEWMRRIQMIVQSAAAA